MDGTRDGRPARRPRTGAAATAFAPARCPGRGAARRAPGRGAAAACPAEAGGAAAADAAVRRPARSTERARARRSMATRAWHPGVAVAGIGVAAVAFRRDSSPVGVATASSACRPPPEIATAAPIAAAPEAPAVRCRSRRRTTASGGAPAERRQPRPTPALGSPGSPACGCGSDRASRPSGRTRSWRRWPRPAIAGGAGRAAAVRDRDVAGRLLPRRRTWRRRRRSAGCVSPVVGAAGELGVRDYGQLLSRPGAGAARPLGRGLSLRPGGSGAGGSARCWRLRAS